MNERIWITASETRHILGGISKSTLQRRTKDLKLLEHGFAVKLGRRILYSAKLPEVLPSLVTANNKAIITGVQEND